MTEIFSDDFETEVDYDNWTGTNKDGDATLEHSNEQKHHNTESSKSWVTDIGNDNAYCYYTNGSDYTTLYVRVYIRIYETVTTSGRYCSLLGIFGSNNAFGLVGLQVRGDGTDSHWSLVYRHNASWSNPGVLDALLEDTWYCVELKVVMSTAGESDGEVQFWLDGVSKFSSSAVDNDDETSDVDSIRCGLIPGSYWAYGTGSNCGFYTDCVVVADAYIGEEGVAAGQPYISRVQRVAGMRSWGGIRAFSKRFPTLKPLRI